MTSTVAIDLPALPSRGTVVEFDVASRSVPGAHYRVVVDVTTAGSVGIACGCPARTRQCWHVTTIAAIYTNRGEAAEAAGYLVTTQPPLALVDGSDPFEGLA